MTEDQDTALGRLLRSDAPSERDVSFRIGLIERRERQRFRKRSLLQIVAAVMLVVLPAIAFALVTEPLAAGLIGVFGISLTAAAVLSARGMRQAMRWLRQS